MNINNKSFVLFTKCLVFMLVFSICVPVNAYVEDVYLVWVNGIQVTEGNKSDVLGELDGDNKTVIFTPAIGESKAKLTLNGATIENGYYDSVRGTISAIQSNEDIIIEIKGDNFLGKYDGDEIGIERLSDKYTVDYGILVDTWNIEFIGDGNLNIVDRADGIKAYDVTFDENFGSLNIDDDGQGVMPPCAISIDGTLTINGGNYYLTSYRTNGITAKKVIINDGFIKIKVQSGSNAINTYDGIIIDENMEVINAQYVDETTTELFTTDEDVNDGCVTIRKSNYSYKFISGDNQKLTFDKIDEFTFSIDGNFSLFQSLKVDDLELIKDEDYVVTEGSTIITFLDNGLAKLNTLLKGDHEINVKYSNGKEVIGKLTINNYVENPKTGDNCVLYFISGTISLIAFICVLVYNKKVLIK